MPGQAVVKIPSGKASRKSRSKKTTRQTVLKIAPSGFDNLPEELLSQIFQLLPNDLQSIRGVCTNWKRVIEIDRSLSSKLKYTFNSVESFQTAILSVSTFNMFPFASVCFRTDSVSIKSEPAKAFLKGEHPQVTCLEMTKKCENNHVIPPTTIQTIVRIFPNLKSIKMDDFTSTYMKYLVEPKALSARASVKLSKIYENVTLFKLNCGFSHHSMTKAFTSEQFQTLLKQLPQLSQLFYKRENSFGYYGARQPTTQQRDMEMWKAIYNHIKTYPGVLKTISFDVPVMVTKAVTVIPGFSILDMVHKASEYGTIIKNYYFPLEELLQADRSSGPPPDGRQLPMLEDQELSVNQLNLQSIQHASFRISSTAVYPAKTWELVLKCTSLKCLILIVDSDPVTDLTFLKYFIALKKLNLKIVSRPLSAVEEVVFQSQLFEQKLFATPLESLEIDQRSVFYSNGRRTQNLFPTPASFVNFSQTYSQLQELTLVNCPCGTDYYCIGIIISNMKSLRILKLEGVGESDSAFIEDLPRCPEERIITINNHLAAVSPLYEAYMKERMQIHYGSVSHLQHLEVKGMGFTDMSVHDFICGLHLKSLFIRNCSNVTDLSLRAISSVGPLRKTLRHFKIFGSPCTILGLDALINNCENLTCVEFQCPNIRSAGFLEFAKEKYLGTTVKLAVD